MTRLDEIKANRQCKRLPITATAAELKEAHMVKMRAKKLVREYQHQQGLGSVYTPTNLGKNHPDYGMSAEDHRKERLKRAM